MYNLNINSYSVPNFFNDLEDPGKEVFQLSKAFLNARRKALKTRFCLEPRRRISAIFENPNSHRLLLNGPDYTFVDGRPTPYGVNQFKRICQNREHTATIIKFNQEIDLALRLESMQEQEKQAEVKYILDRKLKPKGGSAKAKPDSAQ